MIRVTENLRKIRNLLAETAVDAGRPRDAVRLLAVSKKQPLDRVRAAIAAGQLDFGENQAAEAAAKIHRLADTNLVWHFIGHLQANKTRVIAEHFHWVHSIDRIKTAQRLSRQRPESLGPIKVCLQVNVDREDSKSGVLPEDLPELARGVADLPMLELRGLMCLPRIRRDFEEQRQPFARLRELAGDLHRDGIDVDTLSMGMSDDFRAAIFEGSTIVRIGTAIFGPRETT